MFCSVWCSHSNVFQRLCNLFQFFCAQALKDGREPDLSDYKKFKITCENVGFQMLQKMGWKEGEGLGSEGQGIKNPVNKYVVFVAIVSDKSRS